MNKKQYLLSLALVSSMTLAGVSAVSVADNDDLVDMSHVALNLQDAVAIALERIPGAAIEAEIESENDQLFWEISILDNSNQISEVEVDASSGVIINVEVEDD